LTDFDSAALAAEAESIRAGYLADVAHPTLAPWLAPPDLVGPLKGFLERHPFEHNVFGMTRYPAEDESDPIQSALVAARNACSEHGLEFHLASDRAIVDDLWGNVAGHMWASHYGIAFFENLADTGLNYNLTIEVGSMLMAGRRVALLKDRGVSRLPTDLTGKVYRSVDLSNSSSVSRHVHEWIALDLGLGRCGSC
jgi:hypothetical protein